METPDPILQKAHAAQRTAFWNGVMLGASATALLFGLTTLVVFNLFRP